MPKINLYTIAGNKSGEMELPKEIFAAKINGPLMAQAVKVYLSNQRKAKAKTKTRSEIALTKAKWFRQKGTGRARHGAKSAHIFVGGGVSHGPTGEQNYHLNLSKRMRKQALFSALTSKLKSEEIMVVKDLEKVETKTKKMNEVLDKLTQGWKLEPKNWKLTLILSKNSENITRSARNIPGVFLAQAHQLNTYEVLNGGKLIFTQQAIEGLEKTWI
jgi:large subunit ribosomal protein L4